MTYLDKVIRKKLEFNKIWKVFQMNKKEEIQIL